MVSTYGHAEVEHNLTNHPPDMFTARRMERLRNIAKEFAHAIVDDVPECWEQAHALTHLEQSVMWTMAALARHQTGSTSG